MRTATLANISPLPRRHWGVLTLPTALAVGLGNEATFVADDGRRWRAVRGSTKGNRTVYRVRAQLEGSELVTGRLVAEQHPEAVTFTSHRWVTDDIPALLPTLGVRVGDGSGLGHRDHWGDTQSLTMVDHSAAHQRWHLVQRIPAIGVHFEWWGDVFHDDPVVHVFGKLVWSDRNDSRPVQSFQIIALQSGERMALDFMTRHGGLEPAALHSNWLQVLNREPVSLQDGAGLAFSGSLLTFVSGNLAPPPVDPADGDGDINNLRAAVHGPVLGVSHEWAGQWLANRNLPRFRQPRQRDDIGWQAFLGRLGAFAGWTATREFGCNKIPGNTGDQEDFGATKGTDAVVPFDPRAIYRLRYSVQAELLRGVEHYEDDGQPLNAAMHPNWVTWAGVTHWHPGVSPDRIGKTAVAVSVGTGFEPHDDQHRSHNNLAAYIALSDDPCADAHARHLATVDEAAFRVRFPNRGVDSPRAQGRVAQALAQLASVVDDATAARFLAVMRARLLPINNNPTLRVAGPMKVLGWGMPETRKSVYTPDGQLGRWVSMWEHGLALVGFYVAQKHSNDPALLSTMRTVAETIATFGFFQSGTEWWTVAEILWSDGDAPTDGVVAGSRAITAAPNAGDVRSWTFAGALVAREVLGPEHPMAAKLAAYTDAMTGGIEADDRRTAEWWAAVQSVAF